MDYRKIRLQPYQFNSFETEIAPNCLSGQFLWVFYVSVRICAGDFNAQNTHNGH